MLLGFQELPPPRSWNFIFVAQVSGDSHWFGRWVIGGGILDSVQLLVLSDSSQLNTFLLVQVLHIWSEFTCVLGQMQVKSIPLFLANMTFLLD